MARKIRILPDALANQIAAGEVVERPASVVKELVENALDAAATRVDIEIRNGGKTEIRVADDGTGMSREDALLSLDRHATSKIATPEDLQGVRTFGFRGEALPSIASVSRLTLDTAESSSVGTRIRGNGGRILAVEDRARQPGTTVVAQNLFFNTPARAKFLSTAAVESRSVADVVTTLALAHLSAGFRLESNGRLLLELAATGDLVTRVAGLWGEDFAGGLIALSGAESAGRGPDASASVAAAGAGSSAGAVAAAGAGARDTGGVRVAGLVERPDAASASARRVRLFIGGRPFRDTGILAAAERAYRTTVPGGARPSLLLYIDVPGPELDVNVHPAKTEVRFRHRSAVESAVESAVRRALAGEESAATFDPAPPPPQLRRSEPSDPEQATDEAADQYAFFVSAHDSGVDSEDGNGAGRGAAARAEAGDAGDQAAAAVESGSRDPAHVRERDGDGILPSSSSASLWQVHDTYILAETRGGLLVIDQHSAHERILFEEIMRALDRGSAEGQHLLFPITLRLSPAEYQVVEDSASFFSRAGFDVEPFGGRTAIVRAVPDPHPYFDAERCLREMITELAEGSELTRAAGNQHERIAMTFACKGAIKAGQRLSQREIQRLFERLFATELPHHDVHGRPTIVRLSLKEMERRFGRH